MMMSLKIQNRIKEIAKSRLDQAVMSQKDGLIPFP
jgi:hypothetical protein